MKKAGNRVIIINSDNNRLNLGESKSRLPAAIAIALGVFAGAAVRLYHIKLVTGVVIDLEGNPVIKNSMRKKIIKEHDY